jgi:hypothetical protein
MKVGLQFIFVFWDWIAFAGSSQQCACHCLFVLRIIMLVSLLMFRLISDEGGTRIERARDGTTAQSGNWADEVCPCQRSCEARMIGR